MRKHFINHSLIVLGVYIVLTGIYFYPVIFSLFEKIIGDRDSFYFIWDLWWYKYSMLDMLSNPLKSNMIFYPFQGAPVPWSSPINELLGAFFSSIVSPQVVFNIIVVSSFPLAGLFSYLYLHQLTGDPLASFLGGFIYAFSPYHFSHANQMGLATIQWIPLFLIALRNYSQNKVLRNGLYLMVSAWLVALSDPYTLIYFLVYFLCVNVIFNIRSSLGLLAILPVLAGPFYIPLVHALSTMQGAADLTVEAITYSQDVLKYIIPWKFHPIWGGYFSNFFPGDRLVEMFLGYIPLFLSITAVSRLKGDTHVKFWSLFWVIALVLSLGPYLKVNGNTGIPMPYWVIWKIPLLSFLRMPQRFGLEVSLALSVLAACGLKSIYARVKGGGARTILAGALCVGIGLEYLVYFPIPVSSARVPHIYTILKSESVSWPGGAILELPLGGEDAVYRYMYYQTKHGRPLVNGGLPRDPDWAHDFQDGVPFLQEIGDPVSVSKGDILPRISIIQGLSVLRDELGRNGVDYVIVHKHEYSGTGVVASMRKILGHPFYEDTESAGFRIPYAPEHSGKEVKGPILVLGSGWHGLEYTGDTAFRWMKGRGHVKVLSNPSKDRVKLHLSLLREFSSAETLIISINGSPIEEIDMSGMHYAGSVMTKSFILPRGDSILSISVKEGAFSPFKERGVPDPRRISIGVSQMEILPLSR